MVRLEWLFLMQVVIGILMLVLLQKQIRMKKQIDEITREVMQYVSYIIQDEEEQKDEKDIKDIKKINGVKKSKSKGGEMHELDEAQNRLIQAVLGEYFP